MLMDWQKTKEIRMSKLKAEDACCENCKHYEEVGIFTDYSAQTQDKIRRRRGLCQQSQRNGGRKLYVIADTTACPHFEEKENE